MNRLTTSDCRAGSRRRGGFTLVELIVVMAIIGLLAAILIPTIRAAMIAAKVTAIAADLADLDIALDEFKDKWGEYPPDFSDRNLLIRQVQKAWPRITTNELRLFLAVAYHRGAGITGPQWEIDPAEALVFWLGGFSEDQLHPFTGPGGPFSSTERNADNAFFPFDADALSESGQVVTYEVEFVDAAGGNQTFRFNARESNDDSLLHGLQNDPFPVVMTRGTQLPVVYLDSHSYANTVYPPHGYTNSIVTGDAHPYLSDRPLVNGGFEWINPRSFQLISAGLDEDFGGHGADASGNFMFKRFDSGTYYKDGDFDNVTNSSGGTLEDAIP